MIRPATPEEAAAARGCTVEEYRADPMGTFARSLTERSGIDHHVWRVPAEGLRPAEFRVLPAAYAQPGWERVA